MGIREMRLRLGDTQSEFAARYGIPFRTVQNWEIGLRKPPKYVLNLLEERVRRDLVNRKTAILPMYDAQKMDLPKRSDFIGAMSWLRAVRETLGGKVVFALDKALMCEGRFGGRSEEYIVWVYGDDSLTRYNGVVLLGNTISPHCVQEKHGLCFTDFNRTLSDAFANERILDMQGITEAVSKYYYTHGESFRGLSIERRHQGEVFLVELADRLYKGQPVFFVSEVHMEFLAFIDELIEPSVKGSVVDVLHCLSHNLRSVCSSGNNSFLDAWALADCAFFLSVVIEAQTAVAHFCRVFKTAQNHHAAASWG